VFIPDFFFFFFLFYTPTTAATTTTTAAAAAAVAIVCHDLSMWTENLFFIKKKRPRKRPRSRRTLGRQSSQPHPPQLLVVVVMAEGAHRGEESWEVAPGFEPSSSWRSS